MHMPLFIPSEPYIYHFMWDYSNPFAGPDGDPRLRTQAPAYLRNNFTMEQLGATQHPFHPLSFLDSGIRSTTLPARCYWYQYTEFATFPALQRFRSIANLAERLLSLSAT